MHKEKDCIFCKIITKELSCYKIYEDENLIVILDINPYSIGHTLIIPKEHFNWLWEIGSKEYYELMGKTKYFANILQKVFKTEWVEMVVAGIGIQHTHIHLLPRQKNDGLGELPTKPIIPKPNDSEMQKIAENIRKAL
ncbi:HIT family protein [Candidatus Pacearchaeota archaeon]|nr:HIT family protein [Candidatus Pacearchaeota archaeon]